MVVLVVSGIQGRNFRPVQGFTFRNGYYITLNLAGVKKKTSAVYSLKDSNSLWNDIIEFEIGDATTDASGARVLQFIVKRASFIPFIGKSRYVGWSEITLKEALATSPNKENIVILPLFDNENQPTHSMLSVKFQLMGDLQFNNLEEPVPRGYFIIDVYCAEGLPRMDLGLFSCSRESRSQLVDPYLVVTYAGIQVQTSVAQQNASPAWNERLFLQFCMPLESDSIVLQLKDRDLMNTDDVIATTTISLKSITANWKESLLPTFGPAYVSFYGSQRKYKFFETESIRTLNCGHIEGCAFRGRVLLRIATELDAIPTIPDKEIPVEEVAIVSLLSRTSTFILRATILDCYLLFNGERSTIEASLGLFGDSQGLESNFQRASCLQPFTPIVSKSKDGAGDQYASPWTAHKPSVIYDVELQVSAHRLELANALLFSTNLLDTVISDLSDEKTKIASEKVVELFKCYHQILKCFDDWEQNDELHTELDKHLRRMILAQFQEIFWEAVQISDRIVNNVEIVMEEAVTRLKSIRDSLVALQNLDPQNEFPDVFLWLYQGWEKVAYCRIPVAHIWYSSSDLKSGHLCNKVSTFSFKFPTDEIKEGADIPGVLRANLWFGPQSDFESCIGKIESANAEFILMAETPSSESNFFENIVPIKTGNRWTDAVGQILHKKENFPEAAGWKFEKDWNSNISRNDENATKFSRGDFNERIDDGDGLSGDGIGGGGASNPSASSPRKTSQQAVDDSKLAMSRHLRKLVPLANPVLPPSSSIVKYRHKNSYFHFSNPSFYLVFNEVQYRELRVYVYQARNLPAGDDSGLSDPFLRATFLSYVTESQWIAESLCPIWNQTLIIQNIVVPGTPGWIADNVPDVIVDVFDHDDIGIKDLLGRAMISPLIGPINTEAQSVLSWRPILLENETVGELLVGAELIESISDNLNLDIPFSLPTSIKPVLANASIEILCIELQPGDPNSPKLVSPFCEFYYNDTAPLAVTDVIEFFPEVITFVENFFFVELKLPEEDKFLPSLSVVLKTRGPFGQSTVAGAGVVGNLQNFVLKYQTPTYSKEISNSAIQNDITSLVSTEHATNVDETTAFPQKKSTLKKFDKMYTEFRNFGDKWIGTSRALRLRSRKTAEVALQILDEREDLGLDWWNRYYASKGDISKSGDFFKFGFGTIQIYDQELERFGCLKDYLNLVSPLPIYSGNTSSRMVAATIAAIFRISRINDSFTEENLDVLKPDLSLDAMGRQILSENFDFTLRLYLIRSHDLRSRDFGGQSDPYVVVKIGDQESEVPGSRQINTLNPTFGCMYELPVNLRNNDRHMFIRVMDLDVISGDDMIGETYVDLRSRVLAPCRATCGLSPQYLVSGPYAWRDYCTPKELLEEMVELHSLPKPEYVGQNRLLLGNTAFDLLDFEYENEMPQTFVGPPEERLALHVLHHYNFVVKEHIETRALYHPFHPGQVQGKLEMWIDLIPTDKTSLADAVKVAPREPVSMVLRVIIFNAFEVILDDNNILGDKMSDVYVKCWLKGLESDVQQTDVHYRSFNGKANFNWRMVFPFQYVPGENAVQTYVRKNVYDLQLTEEQNPPVVCITICDYDLLSRDDCIGYLELDLTSLMLPEVKLRRCTFESYQEKMRPGTITANLFKKKWARGFWLCPSVNNESNPVGGKLEMQIELLTSDEVILRPAGLGREEPNTNPQLDPPLRPATSFNWLTSPFKFLGYLWDRFKVPIIIAIIVALLVTCLLVFGRTIMEAVVQKLVFRLK